MRTLALRADVDVVYVATGPLYERDMDPLPGANEPHMVPSGYWKVVAIEEDDGPRVAGFIFDQETPSGTSICTDIETLHGVEQRSGPDFFYELEAGEETELEESLLTSASDLGY